MNDNWRDQAACKGMDTNLFYPGRGERVCAEVVAACNACPVRGECAEYAIKHEANGTWALLTEQARRKARKVSGITRVDPSAGMDPTRQPSAHGTNAGYMQHRKEGTPTCIDCRCAHSVVVHQAKRARQERQEMAAAS